MSDIEALFAFLVGMYLIECLGWAPRDVVLFRSPLRRGWRILTGSSFHGHDRGGLFMLNPVPALGSAVQSQQWPVSISPTGVYAWVAQVFNPGGRHFQSERFHRFDAIQHVEAVGRELLINREPFARMASEPFAAELAAWIRELRQTPAAERSARIDAMLENATRTDDIRARVERWQQLGGSLYFLCNLLFVVFFVIAPIMVWRVGLTNCWVSLLLSIVLLMILIIYRFARAHRALYPEDRPGRWTHIATMAFFPPAAIRAHDALSRRLLVTYHPLAIARILCSAESFREFASATLRDLQWPVPPACPSDDPEHSRTEAFFRIRLQHALERVIRESDIDPADLLLPPAREEEDGRSYCPRCLCQFLIEEGTCESCGGIPLRPFDELPSADRSSSPPVTAEH
jgi:hypothetical protein